MEYEYLKSYRRRHISHQKLYNKITKQFQQSAVDVNQLRFYDEVLFVLDEQSPGGRANRGVSDELFNQTRNAEGKTSISKMTWAYIENLQTAKLCLLRDESKIDQIKQKQSTMKNREQTYVHLQMIQASVYSRFTKDAILSYAIQPTNIPPVTLQNASNPLLNQQFSFKLEEANEFSIVFMDSGICIGQWTFPDSNGLAEGEYHRLVKSENVTFQVKIRYLPRNSYGEKASFGSKLKQIEGTKTTTRSAFESLVTYQPFLNKETAIKQALKHKEQEQRKKQEEQSGLGSYGSLLGYHVRNLFILLLALILAQCLFAYYSAIEFIDIMLAFYLMGLLMDRQISNYSEISVQFLVICVGFVFCIIKSFFGMASPPFYVVNGVKVFMAVICVILKILVILALILMMNNYSNISRQRDIFFYQGDINDDDDVPAYDEDTIWQDEPNNITTR